MIESICYTPLHTVTHRYTLQVLLFMIENTLAGADYWNCFRQVRAGNSV